MVKYRKVNVTLSPYVLILIKLSTWSSRLTSDHLTLIKRPGVSDLFRKLPVIRGEWDVRESSLIVKLL